MAKYNLSDFEKQLIIDDYVKNYLSIRDIIDKYKIKCKATINKILGANIRTHSEASKIRNLMKPLKHSDKTKSKLRKIRLEFMKNNPDKTAWRLKGISYPEKKFNQFLIDYQYSSKYLIVREKSIFPYFIDFAFIDLKLAIEIDGSQHLNPDVLEKDKLKDKLLLDLGWSIIRISVNELKNLESINTILKITIDKILLKSEQLYEKVGIIYEPKKYIKKERLNCGKTQSQINRDLTQRKVNRPSIDELSELLLTNTYVKIGEIFNVSDNTIRKWCKLYGIKK